MLFSDIGKYMVLILTIQKKIPLNDRRDTRTVKHFK